MDDIPLYIVLTGTCGGHVHVNKPKHKIVHWHFCVYFFFQKQFKYFSTILPWSQQL
jgi:uncharacterized membrane protein YsdA (DUF1294 family)